MCGRDADGAAVGAIPLAGRWDATGAWVADTSLVTFACRGLRKHGVTFEEAATCFADELGLEQTDKVHADRLILVATSASARLLLVVHAVLEADDTIRVSARKTTPKEWKSYEEGTF